MSYGGIIRMWITPNAPSSPVILRSLLDSGWQPGNGSGEIYVTSFDSDPGYPLFETMDDAFAAILAMESRSERWSFPIVWHDFLASVDVVINRQEETITFILSSRTKRLDAVPWCSDHSWYLSRLVPPLQKVGCEVYIVKYSDEA